MIIEADEYILYFCSILNQYRSKTIYEMPLRVFDILSKIFQKALNKIEQSKNIEIAINIITLSFSFFKIDDKKRCYIVDIIKNNKIFKSSQFWNNYISYQIDKDLERINTVKSIKEGNENENKNLDAILLSKILPSADTMPKFELDKKVILNIIEPLMDQYQMKQKSKESLLSLVQNQI